MNIEVTSENAYARKVEIIVPPATVKDELDRAFRSLARTVKLRGFRPGKAPRKVLEAQFGPRIHSDVAQDLIQKAYVDALSSHSMEPVSRPSIVDQGELASADGFKFTIAVEVKPEIEVPNYKGLEVYFPKHVVADDELEAAVESKRKTQSRLVAVEDRAVEVGDRAQVELKVTDGDDVVAEAPGTLIHTAGDPWFAGIEEMLVGMSIDEEKAGKVTFAENARNEDVAGKELDVSVKLLAIQANETPELDDELAKEMGYEGGVEELRAAVGDQLLKGREDAARNQARANLLQVLIEANPFDVPSGMIDDNLKLLEDELRLQQAYAGRDPRSVTFSEAQMADLRNRAAFAAKGGLILEWVSATEEITVDDNDVEAKYVELAEARGANVEAIKGYFVKDGAVDELKQRILEEKALDWLLEQSVLSDVAPVVEAADVAAPDDDGDAAPAVDDAEPAVAEDSAAEE